MIKDDISLLETYLPLAEDRHLVGIKLFANEDEYLLESAPEATHQFFFCLMVKSAAMGHAFKYTANHIYCSKAAEVLGFTSPVDLKSTIYSQLDRNMYGCVQSAKEVAAETPHIPQHSYGLVVKPLESFQYPPDVVMIFGTPYIAMRVLQGYSYQNGIPHHLQFSGMSGLCTELMASAYVKQDICCSVLCSNARFSAEWRDDEMGLAMPYSLFQKVQLGVMANANAYEPEAKITQILDKQERLSLSSDVTYNQNYYQSCAGIAPIGVTAYRSKLPKGKRHDDI